MISVILFSWLLGLTSTFSDVTIRSDAGFLRYNESGPTESVEVEPSDVQPGPDKKQQSLSMQKLEEVFATLHFNRFVDQIIRTNELQTLSNKLEMWAYQTGSLNLVGDLEDARARLERADVLLEAEFRRSGSLSQSAALGYQIDFLDRAEIEINEASFVLDMLVMIALSEK